MAYTDVTHPVIINVTRSASFSVDNYLRRSGVVSSGGTSLSPNEWRAVGADSWGEIATSAELQNFCTSFFSYAGNKELVILEVGTATNEGLKPLCDAVKMFIQKEEAKCYNIALPKAWYSAKTISKTSTFQIPTAKYFADETPKSFDISGTFELADITFTPSKEGVIVIDTADGTFKKADGAEDSSFPVEVTFSSGGTTLGKISIAKNEASASESGVNYSHTDVTKDDAVQKLIMEYSGDSNEVCFFVDVPQTEDPNASLNLPTFLNLKGVQCVVQNSAGESVDTKATVMGICASSFFDIGDNMPASALNYKAVRGFKAEKSTAPQRKAWINSALTFVDELAGQNVILNGRQMDGMPWDYWFYWYLTKFRVGAKITKLILNGANNPVAAIKYDQTGIDTLKINIISELELLKGWGVLTDFAQTYDATSGELGGSGMIVAPSFYKYIAEYPENYKNEILGGFSAFLQIGRFVRQVEWNVSLGG